VPYEDTNFVLQPGQARQDDIQLVRGYVVRSIPPMPQPPHPSRFRRWSAFLPGLDLTFDGATSDQPLRALLHPLLRYDVLVVPAASSKVFPPFLVASKLAQEFRPEDFYVAVV